MLINEHAIVENETISDNFGTFRVRYARGSCKFSSDDHYWSVFGNDGRAYFAYARQPLSLVAFRHAALAYRANYSTKRRKLIIDATTVTEALTM